MIGSSHVRFTPEIEYNNSYHYTNIYSYWLYWLALRDILKTACNITNAMYKGVGGLTMLSGADNQVVCTVGQTDGHNSPDHTTSCADLQWDRIGHQVTLLMSLNGLTGFIMVLRNLTGSKTGHL